MDGFPTVFLFTDIGNFQNRLIFAEIVLYLFLIGFLLIRLLMALAGAPSLAKASISFGNSRLPMIAYLPLSLLLIIVSPIFMLLMSPGTAYYIAYRDEYAKLQLKYDLQQYRITEGVVHVSHIQNPAGHEQGDIITIGGTEFEINAFSGGFGYTTTISHGGALTEGSYARVFYIDNPIGNYQKYLILRVDVKK